MAQKIATRKQAEDYIYSFIPSSSDKLYPGDHGLRRTKYLLSLLDNPQDKTKAIHIAGTSGKGSTAYLTSLLLKSAGFSVGLIIKPHIHDLRERYQINNALISEPDFCQAVEKLIPAIDTLSLTEYGRPTYAEVNATLAFLIFATKKVDYAVIETYLGGLLDCTNVITRTDKIAVISRIGFDHTAILGNTLESIATQKSGIIHPQNHAIALWQEPEITQVITKKVQTSNTTVDWLQIGKQIQATQTHHNGITFTYAGKKNYADLRLNLFGTYQAENAGLALATLEYLGTRDNFTLNEQSIRQTFAAAQFAGRGEIREKNGKTVILDGAHNPQKMQAFLTSLHLEYPQKTFDFLLAFVHGKDINQMLDQIIPLAKSITLTKFFVDKQDWIRKAEDPHEIAKYLSSRGVKDIQVIDDKKQAFMATFEKGTSPIIITGSLYFIGDLEKDL